MLNAKHLKTLEKVLADPSGSTFRWRDLEAMLVALGAERSEGRGSRVRFTLNGVTLFIHRPHPSPEAKPYVVRNIRAFLIESGIEP